MPVITVGRDKLFVALGRNYSAYHTPACIADFAKSTVPLSTTPPTDL